MNIKYYSLNVNGKFFKNFDNKHDAIREYRNSEESEKQLYEITINDDNSKDEQLVSIIDEPPFNEIKWFEIHNTINEYSSSCTGKYRTFEEAKETLKDKEDWWRHRGTGTIYECSINNRTFYVNSKEVYKR